MTVIAPFFFEPLLAPYGGQRVMRVQINQIAPMTMIESGMAISTLMMVIVTRQ
jgi:hypothetical protein